MTFFLGSVVMQVRITAGLAAKNGIQELIITLAPQPLQTGFVHLFGKVLMNYSP